MSIIERLTTLFAPDDCLLCGREGALLCHGCQPKLPPPVGRCFRCQRATSGAACKHCLESAGLNSLHVATNYSGASKLLVACLKFRGNQSAARIMASVMYSGTPLFTEALIVNMPATTAHIRQRGFDQSALIARHLSRRTQQRYTVALRRSGQHHQLGAGREQRLQQLSSSLSVRSVIRDRRIILVDDVLTTGASLSAAAHALLAAGAQAVDAVVFAQSIN